MFTIFSRLTVFAVIAFLVFMPGWCAGSCFYRHHGNGAVPPKSVIGSCCQHKPMPSATPENTAPAPTEMHCCCTDTAIVSEQLTPQNDDALIRYVAISSSGAFADLGLQIDTVAVPVVLGSDPPIRLLFCVWRC